MRSMKQRLKRYSPDEKVTLLRRHLLEHIPVLELCREHELHPNVFYRWQEEFFEGGAAAFAKESSGQVKRLTRQVTAREAQLVCKNEVLAEVREAYVRVRTDVHLRKRNSLLI